MLPLQALLGEQRQLGLVVAVLLGFAFGFVLERAGFGRASKLAAQFYFHDMTVFKVMFSAIVTAMLGLLLAAGLGFADLTFIRENAISETFLWPMVAGGFLLGVGFIISGYCPGTSLVAAASGNLDGAVTVAGVVAGTVIFNEAYPVLERFHLSGARGHLFLYDWLKLPAPVLGAVVAATAIAAFLGAEKLERVFQRHRPASAETPDQPRARRPRHLAFGLFAGLALALLATLSLAPRPRAARPPQVPALAQAELARRLLEEPWSLRILDLRPRAACVARRIPGAECAPLQELDRLGLAQGEPRRALVLVAEGELPEVPAAARAYPGRLFRLQGGFRGFQRFALEEPPPPPPPGAPPAALAAHRFQVAFHAAMTGMKPPPPPPPAAGGTVAPRKKKGGGCSS